MISQGGFQPQFNAVKDLGSRAWRHFRAQAWDLHSRMGLPTVKNESWKYTKTDLIKTEWPLNVDSTVPSAVQDPFEFLNSIKPKSWVLQNVNGTAHMTTPEGQKGSVFEKTFDQPALDFKLEDGFAALNASTARPGWNLNVSEKLTAPILLLNSTYGSQGWTSSLNHLEILPGASCNIVEIFYSRSVHKNWRAQMTRVKLGKGAKLNWVRIQAEDKLDLHSSDVQVQMDESAILDLCQINFGSLWTKNSLNVSINGTRALASLSGFTFARENQHIDQRIVVSHAVGESNSTQLFKNILSDQSRVVLNGKIHIARQAQKVESRQLNQTLLNGTHCEIDNKPELEVYADDVKANHGATIGRMDGDRLFYLLSRGIKKTDAEALLSRAFIDDVVMKISHPDLRQISEHLIGQYLNRGSL